MNILHVIANPKPLAEANSRQLAEAFFKVVQQVNPAATVTEVDLNANPPPFYDYETYRYFWYPVFDSKFQPTAREKAAVQYALAQCALFKKADVVVLTTPMWNFSLPGILKAWIDQVVMPNQTFTIGAQGIGGLHQVKKVVLLTSSGGVYEVGNPRDCLVPELKAAFGFMGITDIEVAWVQGQNPLFFKDGAERKARAMKEASDLAVRVAKLA
jgi:FMN-dependent NADH-azoreductase